MRSPRFVLVLPVLALVLAPACATTKGAEPHDMSAAQHDTMAAKEERVGTAHEREYDPSKVSTRRDCRVPTKSPALDACWSSDSNPTAVHLREAAKHRAMAADHRAASQALRDVEARACVGMSDDNRDMSPFEHTDDIASVEPIRVGSPKSGTHIEGAVITFQPVAGMTTEWLQHLVDCHLARNAVLGHQVPEMPSCPLVPKGVTAKVAPADTGFAVTVRSDDGKTAEEILRRAQSLVKQ